MSHGVHSILREAMVLDALEMEACAEVRSHQMALHATLVAPNLKPGPSVIATIKETMHHLENWFKVSQFDKEGLLSLQEKAKALTKAYEVLEESGILEEVGFDDKLRKMQADQEAAQNEE